MFFSICLF
jgi:coiled-coil domain-containing protein 55